MFSSTKRIVELERQVEILAKAIDRIQAERLIPDVEPRRDRIHVGVEKSQRFTGPLANHPHYKPVSITHTEAIIKIMSHLGIKFDYTPMETGKTTIIEDVKPESGA